MRMTECVAQALDVTEMMGDIVQRMPDHPVDVDLIAADDRSATPVTGCGGECRR